MKKSYFITKAVIVFLFCLSNVAYSQTDNKRTKALIKHVCYLADDKLEGRRAGSNGEKLAADFIAKQFKRNRLSSFDGLDKFFQPFEINDGLTIQPGTFFKSGSSVFELYEDFIPLPYSKTGNGVFSLAKTVFYNTNDLITENEGNPHFDYNESLYQKIKSIHSENSDCVILIFNSKDTVLSEKFDAGNITVEAEVKYNKIIQMKLTGDYFSLKKMLDFENAFKGVDFTRQSFLNVTKSVKVREYIYKLNTTSRSGVFLLEFIYKCDTIYCHIRGDTMKKLFLLLIFVALSFALIACGDVVDDPDTGSGNYLVLPDLNGKTDEEIIKIFDDYGQEFTLSEFDQESEIYQNEFIMYVNFDTGDIVNKSDEVEILVYPDFTGVRTFIYLPDLDGLDQEQITAYF